MQVRQILAIKGSALYTGTPTMTLDAAVAALVEHDVGSLVIFDKGKMVGMLTFREVLGALGRYGASWQRVPVSGVMRADPVSAGPDMAIDDLRRLMLAQRIRYLPVMEGETLLGVISFHDVAKAVLEERTLENRMLVSYIQDVPLAAIAH